MREAFDLVYVVGGHQFAAARLGEIRQRVDPVQIRAAQFVVEITALRVARERGMGLIADTRPDFDIVNTEGNIGSRAVGGQPPTGLVQIVGNG